VTKTGSLAQEVVVPLEARVVRLAMASLACGRTIVTVSDGYDVPHAASAVAFRASSSLPLRLVVRIARSADIYEAAVRGRRIGLNVIDGSPSQDAASSSLEAGGTFDEPWLIDGDGSPRLRKATAFFECEIESVQTFGSGAIFVVRVRGAAFAGGRVTPLSDIATPHFSNPVANRRGVRSLPVLRVATTPNDSGAQVYYARNQGYFQKAGIDVQVTQMSNGSLIALGVLSGEIDVASSSLLSVASAHERGVSFVVVAPGSLWNRRAVSSALVVARDSPARTARDLNGKTVAVNGLLNVTQLSVEAWMGRRGADSSTVNFVEVPFPLMGSAVSAHRVDAALVPQPFLDAAIAGGARILSAPYGAIAPYFMINGWFTMRSFVHSHADSLRRFDAAMGEAARWANSHQDLSRAILEEEMHIFAGPQMARVAYADRLDPALIQPLIDASAKYKSLRMPFPATEILSAQ
jgi:NitT/TauT family transport system substrate-binding protein